MFFRNPELLVPFIVMLTKGLANKLSNSVEFIMRWKLPVPVVVIVGAEVLLATQYLLPHLKTILKKCCVLMMVESVIQFIRLALLPGI